MVGKSRRASGVDDYVIHQFNVDPLRGLDLLWPCLFGRPAPLNCCWLSGLLPVGDQGAWHVSLYLGAIVPLLALCVAGWKTAPSWRGWLTTVALLALIASLGKYAGPLWWARCGPFAWILGPRSPALGTDAWRSIPGRRRGCCYGLLLWVLPGFNSFRYPAKLFPFCAAALAVLAAGWDGVAAGETPRLRKLTRAMFVFSLLVLGMTVLLKGPAVAWLSATLHRRSRSVRQAPRQAGFRPSKHCSRAASFPGCFCSS